MGGVRRCGIRLAGVIAAVLACAACADNDSVEHAQIAPIRGYDVAADGRTMTVSADVACQSKVKVFLTETDTEVRLLAIRNDPSCGADEGTGAMVSATVVLEARLGRRTVVDLGCQLLGRPDPCTVSG